MAAVKVDDLAAAIAAELQDYGDEVAEDVKASVKSAAKTCAATLQRTSPKDTGDYDKGWRTRKAYESIHDLRMEVHNATDYQLTHLLEDGHANVDGGRTEGQPHIQPAADEAAQLLEKDVKIRVGKR